eukprot:SAG31_NODE_14299_length_815_cov_2.557263_1_plen_91_part_00
MSFEPAINTRFNSACTLCTPCTAYGFTRTGTLIAKFKFSRCDSCTGTKFSMYCCVLLPVLNVVGRTSTKFKFRAVVGCSPLCTRVTYGLW